MSGMESRESVQPEPASCWKARLVPLEGPCVAADIVVTHMASRLLTVRCGAPFAPGLPVRVDQQDAILLGEVIACREECAGEYSLLFEMDESLSGLHSLRKLVCALFGDARGEPRQPLPHHLRRQGERYESPRL